MFGYPTGVGCLLVKNESLPLLKRPWFGGGTVNFATVQGRMHLLSVGEAGFEDGTLNYLSIPAVEIGLRHLQRIGMPAIQAHVQGWTEEPLQRLLALHHGNGHPMVRLYGPAHMQQHGGTVTMNFYDPAGHVVDYRRVEKPASEQGLSLRGGVAAVGQQINLPRFLQYLQENGGKSAGAIRVSLGLASNLADVERFLAFAATIRDQTALTIGTVSFDIESCRIVRDSG